MNPLTIIPREGLDPITAARAERSKAIARELTATARRLKARDIRREIYSS